MVSKLVLCCVLCCVVCHSMSVCPSVCDCVHAGDLKAYKLVYQLKIGKHGKFHCRFGGCFSVVTSVSVCS